MTRRGTVDRMMLALCLALSASITAAWPQDKAAAKKAETGWVSLFDGEALSDWKVTEFGGQGEVKVKDGLIMLDLGTGDLTGITWTGRVRCMDYEIALEAMRVAGHDFFCGLTFPVNESCCSLIVGGWGGSLVGISSFDDLDASQNETTTSIEFDNERWYRIRVRVTKEKIEAWIDDKKVVDAAPGNRKVSVRGEVELSQPLGFAAWNTKAALRNIRVRPITPDGDDAK